MAPTTMGAFLFASLLAAVVAIWGVTTQRAIARRRATLDHIVKMESDSDALSARRRFIELANDAGGLAQWADKDKESTDEAQNIRLVLNEFELIAIGIQRGIIDYDFYRRWYRAGTITHWTHGAPFILRLRSRTNNDMIYHEFEELVRWMKENKSPRRSRWIGAWF